MAHPNLEKKEKVIDLGNGMSIWKVHPDVLREQDKNARVMDTSMFERLVANIKKDKRLESLPFCVSHTNESGNMEFEIISGHHRTRAARVAGLMEIFILVADSSLSRDDIISKQLSHNSLQGHDDPQILLELYNEIQSLDAKIETGINPEELKLNLDSIKIDEIGLDLNYEIINIMFLPSQFKEFEEVLSIVDKDAKLYLADYRDFDTLTQNIKKVSADRDVRSLAAIFKIMMDIVKGYYEIKEKKDEQGNSTKKSVLLEKSSDSDL